jgi:serine/threonine-protein kinase
MRINVIEISLLLILASLGMGITACSDSSLDQNNKIESLNENSKFREGATKGLPRSMALIPGEEFLFGNDNPDIKGIPLQLQKVRKWGRDQTPQQKINLPGFYMDRYEVTNEQYRKFDPNHSFSLGNNGNPVVNVSWFKANAYCEFLGMRLPTEMEWEKSARGPNANRFPWGNKFDQQKANTGFSKLSSTSPVGTFPGDVSYYNIYDMAGNVSEWTSSWYQPYKGSDFKNSKFGLTYKVSRGGSYQDMGHYELEIFSTTTFRYYNKPDEWGGDTGFRCAKDAK